MSLLPEVIHPSWNEFLTNDIKKELKFGTWGQAVATEKVPILCID